MRNVVPGFQVSKLASPKIGSAINAGYAGLHGPQVGPLAHSRMVRYVPPAEPPANAMRPGKNPGIKPNGFGVI